MGTIFSYMWGQANIICAVIKLRKQDEFEKTIDMVLFQALTPLSVLRLLNYTMTNYNLQLLLKLKNIP